MQSRNVIPDGDEVRRTRISKGFSQAKLGAKAGLSERAIRNIERGKTCIWYTLSLIAEVLGCPIDELMLAGSAPRIAMMDEVIAAANGELSRPGGILQRLLVGLDKASDSSEAELELLLLLAVRRDVQGNERAAVRLGMLLVQETSSHSPQLHARAVVRTATFYDHAGETEKGLALLDQLLERYTKTALGGQYWWAQYQKATLLSRAGQLKKAADLLHTIADETCREDHRLAVLHQLAVIDFKKRRFADAEKRFLECLQRRLARSKADFRAAYEYRRLRDVYAKTGRLKEAQQALANAERVVRDWSFERYASELKRARE
jgi:transcriptional regulator with XRE-family HTH domain